eukprot:PhM_4_TR1285/c2_g4_i11/m.7134
MFSWLIPRSASKITCSRSDEVIWQMTMQRLAWSCISRFQMYKNHGGIDKLDLACGTFKNFEDIASACARNNLCKGFSLSDHGKGDKRAWCMKSTGDAGPVDSGHTFFSKV